MSVGFTRKRADKILADNIKSDVYVCMSTSTPDEDGGNFSEPEYSTGYARRAVGPMTDIISGQVANEDIVFLFEALEDCGSFTYLGLSDYGMRGDDVFLTAKLTEAVTVDAGYVPLIRRHKLVVGLDKEALEAYA